MSARMEMARNTTGTDNDKANRTALAVVLLWVIGPSSQRSLLGTDNWVGGLV